MKEKIQLNYDAISLRKYFGVDSNSPIDIFSLINTQSDLTVVFYPMRDSISGMSIRDEYVKLIAINSRLTKGRQRFTAAHELCHLFFHDDFKTIICAQDLYGNRNDYEREADQFASFFIAPFDALLEFIDKELNKKKKQLNIDDIVRIEQYFGLSRQATLVRLQSENLITEAEAGTMKTNIIRSAQKLGFDDGLYHPNSENKKYLTIGSYIKLANELLNTEMISSGKYEEFMLEAYRSDIVYGTDAIGEHYD